MKEVIQKVLIIAFIVGITLSFILNDTAGLKKDTKDLNTTTKTKMQEANGSL